MDRERMAKRLEKLKGKVGLYYKNLKTGEDYGYNEEEMFLAASMIKLPLFMCVEKLIAEGTLKGSDKLTVRECDKQPSCGALLSLTGEFDVDIDSLTRLMITISDNTATNMLINHLGMETVKEIFEWLGLEKTSINRLLFNDAASAEGIENYICPKEIGKLLEMIYRGRFISPEISKKIEEVLLLQQIRHKIPGYIGRKKKIANKTGESGDTTHDGAIVFAKTPFILVITSDDTDVPETETFIRQVALELYVENGGDPEGLCL